MIVERGSEFRQLSLERCCKACGVPRSLLYRPGLPHKDAPLVAQLLELHERFPSYGYRRAATALNLAAKHVRSVMKRNGIFGNQKRKPRTKYLSSNVPEGANLLPSFKVLGPGRVFAADVTHVPLVGGGWAFLAAILDIYTRQIVGWSISSRNTAELTVHAVSEMLANKLLKPGWVHHSDRGSNYTAESLQSLVEQHQGLLSYSDKGSPTQNAFVESFFKTLKLEEVNAGPYDNLEDARVSIALYLHSYNRERLHSSLGNKSPDQFCREALNASH